MVRAEQQTQVRGRKGKKKTAGGSASCSSDELLSGNFSSVQELFDGSFAVGSSLSLKEGVYHALLDR